METNRKQSIGSSSNLKSTDLAPSTDSAAAAVVVVSIIRKAAGGRGGGGGGDDGSANVQSKRREREKRESRIARHSAGTHIQAQCAGRVQSGSAESY